MYAHWLWLWIATITGHERTDPFDEPSRPIGECASFSQQGQASGLQLTLHNGCSGHLRCEFSWKVVCHQGTPDGAAASRRTRFKLAPGHSHGVSIVPKCAGPKWEVWDVQWFCRTS
jgi:hypothetical protein